MYSCSKRTHCGFHAGDGGTKSTCRDPRGALQGVQEHQVGLGGDVTLARH
ncbi:hypothetical protein [Streptomyces sp. NPDC056190]